MSQTTGARIVYLISFQGFISNVEFKGRLTCVRKTLSVVSSLEFSIKGTCLH